MLVWATVGLVLVSKKSGMSCVPLDFSLFSSWTSKREPSDINFQLEWIMIDCCHTKCVIKSAYELPTKYDRFQNIWKWDQQVRTLQTENITHSFHMLTLTLVSGTLKVSGRGHRRLSSLPKSTRIEIVLSLFMMNSSFVNCRDHKKFQKSHHHHIESATSRRFEMYGDEVLVRRKCVCWVPGHKRIR